MSAEPKVLIVEDERALAIAFAAAVRRVGAASEVAPTVAQARRKWRESGPFDAVVLDLGLPDAPGLTLLDEPPRGECLPVIVVTAHGEPENAAAAKERGVREFFTKPLDYRAFTAALGAVLREGGASTLEEEPVPVAAGGLPDSLRRELRDWLAASLAADAEASYDDLSGALESALIEELLPHYDGRLARLAADLKANRATLRRRLRGE